jgi:hypothetical protein
MKMRIALILFISVILKYPFENVKEKLQFSMIPQVYILIAKNKKK